MPRVQLSSLGAGVAQSASGAVGANKSGTIYLQGTATPATVYSARTAGSTDTSGTFITDSNGHIPGWIDSGTEVDITIAPAPTVTCIPGGPAGATGATGSTGIGANWRGIWSSGTTYATGDGVYGSDSQPYVSNVGSNLNHNPVGDGGTHWGKAGPTYVGYGSTFFNVKDAPYNAAGDGTTDDTAAVQAAIDAAIGAGGGTVYFPNGVYLIHGALQTTNHARGYNAQLCLWSTTVGGINNPSLVLRGDRPMGLVSQNSTTGGAIIKSDIAGTGTKPALLAGPSDGGALISLSVELRDIAFRCPNNPSLTAVDGDCLWGLSITDSRVDTSEGYASVTQPTHFTGRGIVMPRVVASTPDYVRNVSISGYYSGFTCGEHSIVDDLVVHACYIAVVPSGSLDYPPTFLSLSVFDCPYGVTYATPGAGLTDFPSDMRILIERYETEYLLAGGAWTARVADVYDVEGGVTGGHLIGHVGFVNTSLPIVKGYKVGWWIMGNGDHDQLLAVQIFTNSWNYYGAAGPNVFIDRSGIVHLAGAVYGGTLGTVAFNLPRPFRPHAFHAGHYPAVNPATLAPNQGINIGTNGDVTIYDTPCSLYGITYLSDDRWDGFSSYVAM